MHSTVHSMIDMSYGPTHLQTHRVSETEEKKEEILIIVLALCVHYVLILTKHNETSEIGVSK
jgi:hypothetical protein